MRKHPMSHILVDSRTALVHHSVLPGIPKDVVATEGRYADACNSYFLSADAFG
jgi:hypothetical protein